MDLASAMTFLAGSALEDAFFFRCEGEFWDWELSRSKGGARGWNLARKRFTDERFVAAVRPNRLSPAQVVGELAQDPSAARSFVQQVGAVVRQQVAFAKGVVDEARRAFGPEIVVQAREEADQLNENLLQLIEGALSTAKAAGKARNKPVLRTIQGGVGVEGPSDQPTAD